MSGMTRERRLAEIFVEVADSLVEDFDVIDLLHRLSARCVELLDVSAAGILLADAHGELQVIAASDEHTRLLELFALQHDQGPCVECYRLRHGPDEHRLVAYRDDRRLAAVRRASP